MESGKSTTPKPRGRPQKVVYISDDYYYYLISFDVRQPCWLCRQNKNKNITTCKIRNRKQTNNLDKPTKEYNVEVNIINRCKADGGIGKPKKSPEIHHTCMQFHPRRMARVAIRHFSPLCLLPYPAFQALEILLQLPLSSRLVAFPILTFQVVGRLYI
jgi:hypothetical protein